VAKGRGARPKKVTERAFRTEAGPKVTVESRRGLDGRSIVAALREATARAETELGDDQAAA
jgi:hypothetical protein